jgi:hypothetical protein
MKNTLPSQNQPMTKQSFWKNFTVVACEVYELEFLYLDFNGNRKANFYYENGIAMTFFGLSIN